MSGGEVDGGAGPAGTGPGTDTGAARRRRRAVLAGHSGDRRVAELLAGDADPTVRGAALGALGRLGPVEDEELLRALGDSDPGVRRRAVALTTRRGVDGSPGVEVIDRLVEMLDDLDPSVVEMAAWAFGEFAPDRSDATLVGLCRVAAGHDSPLCREAAVAALGAIGAPQTLSVVIDALDDTVNIRRRAAIALAAFDDPRAEEGLRRCLGDRDWQVRQAAEELLAAD